MLKKLKKLLGYLSSYTFYYIGHLSYKLSNIIRSEFIFTIYQSSMNCSTQIQDWSGNNGPWEKVNDNKDN